jgi:outer membrane lipoprotein-sorting protein
MNSKTCFSIVVAGIALSVWARPMTGQDLTDVAAIVERANLASYYAGGDGRSAVRMTITDSQGRERVRQFVILRRDVTDGGDQDYAVLFSRPADVRNTVFLVKKHVGSDDDRWLYLPSLDLVKRIAAGDKRTSFVGSHFVYEDVSGRGLDEDTHELVETTEESYVVRNTPVDAGSVEFTSWTVWIDKNTFLPMKMEYIDDAGETYRRIEALDVGEPGGYSTVTRMQVSDLRSGGTTVAEFQNVEYDLGIPENIFAERTLRSPSRRWFAVR